MMADKEKRPRAAADPRRVSGVQPAIVDTEVDLPRELQDRIDELFTNLTTIDLYVLLGVARNADRKEIKRAYYNRTLEFHPDRHFRKRLGTYKAKLEAIFVRMTDAHDLLCSAERRAEYDSAVRANRFSLVEGLLEAAAAEMAGAEESARRESVVKADPGVRIDKTSAPPPTPTPSLGAPIARLRELHDKRMVAGRLTAAEEAVYERLRDELSHLFLAAQGLVLKSGETARQELRVSMGVPLDLSTSRGKVSTKTLDVSLGGFAARARSQLPAGARYAFVLHLAAAPLEGHCRVVTCAPYPGGGVRVSFAIEPLPARETDRLEMAVFDAALAAFGP
jgi:curved DNA-binding protein CbpA